MTTVTSKKVRFSKFSQKKAARDNKRGSTSTRWDMRDNLNDFKPKMSNADGTIEWPEDWREHVMWLEAWSRKKAIVLWDEIYPENKAVWDEFFQWNGNEFLRNNPLINDPSPLDDFTPEVEEEQWKLVTNKRPKKAQENTRGNLEQGTEVPPSVLKNKRKLFCFDDMGARTYIVDSGASFHIVSRREMTEKEHNSITKVDQPIVIQTANGLLTLTEQCKIYVRDLKVTLSAYILDDTVSLLSLGLLVEELGYSYIWNPRHSPMLRKGNITVRCHPMNNVPHIYPGAVIEDASTEAKGGSLPPLEDPDTDEDKSKGQPELEESSPSEGHADDEDDVPKVRLRP